MERYHDTPKQQVKLLAYELPSAFEEAIVGFVEYYNQRRNQEGMGTSYQPTPQEGGKAETAGAAKELRSDQNLHWRPASKRPRFAGGAQNRKGLKSEPCRATSPELGLNQDVMLSTRKDFNWLGHARRLELRRVRPQSRQGTEPRYPE